MSENSRTTEDKIVDAICMAPLMGLTPILGAWNLAVDVVFGGKPKVEDAVRAAGIADIEPPVSNNE